MSNRPEKDAPADDFLAALTSLCGQLLYPSESDEPCTGFVWPASAGSAGQKMVAGQHAPKSPMVGQTMEAFFQPLAQSDQAEQWEALRAFLLQRLRQPQVWRVGKRRISVYLIGQLADGRWAGVQTVSIET